MVKNILVVLDSYKHNIPDVLKDYILSLNLITDIITMTDLSDIFNNNKFDLNNNYIITQMILTPDFFQFTSKVILDCHNICFLNVEMLTESLRMGYIIDIVKHTNFKI